MTCVRHDIPVTAVVFHNRQWGAEKKNQVDFYNSRFVGGNLDSSRRGRRRQGDGRRRHPIDRLDGRRPARCARPPRRRSEGKTTVLEIMCTRELGDPFRRDALSQPVRHLDKYKATAAREHAGVFGRIAGWSPG